MQLYAFDTPDGRKISVALEETGLPYEVRVVDIAKAEQHDPARVKISPNHKIPARVAPDGPSGRSIGIFAWGAPSSDLISHRGRTDAERAARAVTLDAGWRSAVVALAVHHPHPDRTHRPLLSCVGRSVRSG